MHAEVVRGSVAVVRHLKPDDLDRPTPCRGWTVRDLLMHMTVQHRGFAAAARGTGADLAVWQVRPLAEDPIADYASAAEEVIAAFAPDDVSGPVRGAGGRGRVAVAEREFALPEISTERTIPGRVAVGFHFLDYVVHGWDMARALDVEYAPSREILEAALPIAEAVPDGDRRLVPGASFASRLPVSPDAGLLDRILALLGRSPDWQPPHGRP
jgi:uncharacterized protein (TIGR03086 family)